MDAQTLRLMADALQALADTGRGLAYFAKLQTSLLLGLFSMLLIGFVVLGLQLRAVSADLKAIAAMTAEALRRIRP